MMAKYYEDCIVYLGDIIEGCDTPFNNYLIKDRMYVDLFSGQIKNHTCVDRVCIRDVVDE